MINKYDLYDKNVVQLSLNMLKGTQCSHYMSQYCQEMKGKRVRRKCNEKEKTKATQRKEWREEWKGAGKRGKGVNKYEGIRNCMSKLFV